MARVAEAKKAAKQRAEAADRAKIAEVAERARRAQQAAEAAERKRDAQARSERRRLAARAALDARVAEKLRTRPPSRGVTQDLPRGTALTLELEDATVEQKVTIASPDYEPVLDSNQSADVLDVTPGFGVDGSGNPYYDPAGPSPGERALMAPAKDPMLITPATRLRVITASRGAAGQIPVADGAADYNWVDQTAISGAGVWAAPSGFGSAYRPAVDLLMSTFDTNPASTDQTVAFQNAFGAAATAIAAGVATVRIILDSRRKYQIGGAVTAGPHGQYAQVPIPWSNTIAGTIQLVGMPGGNDYLYIGLGQSKTVIESTLGSAPSFVAGTGIASIFGGPASFSTGHTFANFSWIRFATENVTIRSANPVICGIDAGWIHGFFFDGLLAFDTDFTANIGNTFPIGSITPCANAQAIPIVFPFSNCWYGTLGDTLIVSNWLCGPMIGEYLDCRRIIVFAVPNAALCVDYSVQVNRIGFLTDWDNAYGIASTYPSAPTPFSPGSPFGGSNFTGTTTAPLEINSWSIQRSGPAPPAALDRVYDLVDTHDMIPVDAKVSQNQGGTGGVVVGGLALIGQGASLTGQLSHARIVDRFRTIGVHSPAVPASGVAIRNPNFRDSFVTVEDGVDAIVTSVSVNNTNQPGGIVTVPANGIISITWTGAGTPSWNWMVT